MSRPRFGNNRFTNIVPAGAENDDDNGLLMDDECEDRHEKFGEIKISQIVEDDNEPCSEEELLFGPRNHRRPFKSASNAAFHPWFSLGLNEKSSEDDEPYVVKPQLPTLRETQWQQPDTRTDRELVDFLKAFDCEPVYDILHNHGISLRQLLEMTEEDLLQMGLDGDEWLLQRRKLLYGMDAARKHEWISNEAVNFVYGLLDAGRMPEERERAVQRANRDLGSAAQQVLAASKIVGVYGASMGYLQKLLYKCQHSENTAERQADLEEMRINAENLVRTADRLKGSLCLLRSVMADKLAAPPAASN